MKYWIAAPKVNVVCVRSIRCVIFATGKILFDYGIKFCAISDVYRKTKVELALILVLPNVKAFNFATLVLPSYAVGGEILCLKMFIFQPPLVWWSTGLCCACRKTVIKTTIWTNYLGWFQKHLALISLRDFTSDLYHHCNLILIFLKYRNISGSCC